MLIHMISTSTHLYTPSSTCAGGWDGDAEWGLDAHRRVKRQVEKRVRAELSVAFKKEVAKKQRECLAAAEVAICRRHSLCLICACLITLLRSTTFQKRL
jgi:hypothetical protein